MSEQGFCSQQSKSNVGGLAPFLEDGGVGEVVGTGSVLDHGHDNLSIFQWYDTRVVGSANDAVISGDFFQ
jgi:hypothetical protein